MQMNRSGRKLNAPLVYGEEEHLLKDMNPSWIDQRDKKAHTAVQNRLDLDEPDDDEEDILNQKIARYTFGDGDVDESKMGLGYIQPPNARFGRGYISPAGGWLNIPILLASLAPMLFGASITQTCSKQKRGGVMFQRPPNLTNAQEFFKDAISQAVDSGHSVGVIKQKFGKLLAGQPELKRLLSAKKGGSVPDKLQMGHLMIPLIHNHLRKALKGEGAGILNQIMDVVETDYDNQFSKDVEPTQFIHGGSLLGTLWSGLKNVFGKLASNPKLQKLASNVGNKAISSANKVLPNLADLAVNKIANYAEKKLTGSEPSAKETDEEAEDNDTNFEERDTVKKIAKKRPTTKMLPKELPSGRSDSALRKKLVNQRKQKALVPIEQDDEAEHQEIPTGPMPGQKVVGWNGSVPVYGWGLKKKACGGAWAIRLDRT